MHSTTHGILAALWVAAWLLPAPGRASPEARAGADAGGGAGMAGPGFAVRVDSLGGLAAPGLQADAAGTVFLQPRAAALLGVESDAPLDSDDDGLPDHVETDTGVYVSPQDTGSDPLNPDSDGDGISDGDEVAAGSDPNVAEPRAVPMLGPAGLAISTFLLGALGAAKALRRRTR